MADPAVARQTQAPCPPTNSPTPRLPLEQLITGAREAAAGRDWPAALALWRQVAARSPEGAVGWVGTCIALRELGRLDEARDTAQTAQLRFPDHIGVLIEVVATLQKQQDWHAALAQWAVIRERHPANSVGYLGAVWPLRVLGKFDETEALLADAVARFPEDPQIAVQYATIAGDSGRLAEALARWQRLRDGFPNEPRGYTGGSSTLRQLQRFEEAEQLLAEAINRLPDHPDVAREHAALAEQMQDWETATARWEAVRRNFPDQPFGHVGLCSVFVSQSKSRQAETLLEDAITRFPHNFELRMLYARAAMQLNQLADALPRWRAALAIGPQNLHAITGVAECLLEMGAFDEAEAQLQPVRDQRLKVPQLAIVFGNLATRRKDWAGATRYWEEARDAFPEHRELAHRFNAARMRMLDELDEHPEGNHPPAPKPDAATLADPQVQRVARILETFESLGDNCEFGTVQRAFGLEPLGLLRWTATPPDRLTEALITRFPGVGDLSQTELKHDVGEYFTEDKRFYMMMHTFINISTESPETLLRTLCKRLTFLRRKLLEDLAEGEKIFLYKSTAGVGDDLMHGIWEALNTYGPNRMLAVQPADADHPAGNLRLINPSFAVGYLDFFSVAHPSIPAWQSLCERAHQRLCAPAAARQVAPDAVQS